jgi:hypothetical protein
MDAPTGRVCLRSSNGVYVREADRHGCQIAPRPALKRGVFLRFHQHCGKIRLSAIFGRSNKVISVAILRGCRFVTLFEPRARSTMFRRAQRCAYWRNQYSQQSQYCSSGPLWPARTNLTLLVHAYSLTLPRCGCFVNHALLLGFRAHSFLQDFAPRRHVFKRARSGNQLDGETFLIGKNLVGLARFELATTGLGNRCSIHLSYSPARRHYITFCATGFKTLTREVIGN